MAASAQGPPARPPAHPKKNPKHPPAPPGKHPKTPSNHAAQPPTQPWADVVFLANPGSGKVLSDSAARWAESGRFLVQHSGMRAGQSDRAKGLASDGLSRPFRSDSACVLKALMMFAA